MDACFWALLSVNELEFIHASCLFTKKLQGVSLFDLIHPNEVSLAKRDLYKFMNSNLLGGSVTRCRLKDYNDNNYNTATTSNWIVVDIIMYVATENLVLAFFHRERQGTSLCGNEAYNNTNELKSTLLLSISEENNNNNNADINSSPNQFFHILDNRTKSVLLSWPDHYPNETIMKGNGAQIDFLLEDRPMLPSTLSCFHCVQNPIRFNSFGEKISSIQIQFGFITFVLIHKEKVKKLTLSLPSSPMYNYSNNNNKQQTNFIIDQQRDVSPPVTHPHNYYQQKTPIKEERHSFSYSTRPTTHYYHPYGEKTRTSAPTSPVVRNNNNKRSSAIKLEHLLSPVIHDTPTNNKQLFHHHQHTTRNQCQSCGTDSSPEWRRGPTGHKTLCNACGLRYSRSVARQGKMANQQQKMVQQHQLLTSPQSPPLLSSSCSSSPSSFYNNLARPSHHSPQQRQQQYYYSNNYSVL